MKKQIICCDFDGTLCEEKFPEIGEPKLDVINWVKKQQKAGHKIILWTCRESELLIKAIIWCRDKHGIIFDSINENIPELKFSSMGQHKAIADIYLDDKSLKISEVLKIKDANKFRRGK